jgi:hypothetical protein
MSSHRLFVAILVGLACWFAIKGSAPKIDEDTWWHLRVGEWIDSERRVPTYDSFSQVSREKPREWIAYSWLFEWGLFQTYQVLGLFGILLVRQLMIWMVWMALLRTFLSNPFSLRQGLLFALGIIPISLMGTDRPWHFTICFSILTLQAIEQLRHQDSWKPVWWLPLIFCIWSNIHIQFVMGLGLLGMACFAAWMEKKSLFPFIGLFLLCFLSTLVNPYGFQLYFVVWEYATQLAPLRLVVELRPPSMMYWWNWILLGLLIASSIQVVSRRFPIWDTMLLIAGAYFSLRMQRDIWFGIAVSFVILFRNPKETLIPGVRWREVGITLIPFVLIIGFWGYRSLDPSDSLSEMQKQYYPANAVESIRKTDVSGPIYNEFTWGGYLIFNLKEFPVSIDGRTNFYGNEYLERSMATWAGKEGWDRDPDLLKAKIILGPRTQHLTELLLQDARWHAIHEDPIAVVFVPVSKKFD